MKGRYGRRGAGRRVGPPAPPPSRPRVASFDERRRRPAPRSGDALSRVENHPLCAVHRRSASLSRAAMYSRTMR
ncbi:unnamed protein product [Arctia plantaginis]|uniref:Uncharacterized protein n=1 Tax=Arctia plantaginis TaxID=874455 RepID=A0A8S1A2V3_ARCPL|nr:unnamed protein product [Arctia plantaginis]